ncbi:MAG: GNAT family N-acetyltransferase [Bacteroidota bacterium]
MKIFFSESNNDYSTYTFNYAVYCMKENREELPMIYARGFLPYSSDPSLTDEVYYLARSLRVDTEQFADISENRRVDRKVADLDIQVHAIPKANLDLSDPDFLQFCLSYAKKRFSNDAMNEERLLYILNRESASHLLRFESNDRTIGYVLAVIEGDSFHYWYAFFHTNLMDDFPIGKWIMWRSIHWAKEHGLRYVYLGTCYGRSALYKARDFKGVAFFDGMGWNEDRQLLKSYCKSDEEARSMDRFKLSDNRQQQLEHLP